MEHILCLKIENDIHYASVTAEAHPQHQVYHVVFEDGYENIFFTDVETGNWIEEDLGETELAASLGLKMNMFWDEFPRPRKTLSWCRASLVSMVINFGFYTFKKNGQTVFEVYRDNHKFLCNLARNKKGKWMVCGIKKPLAADPYTRQIKVIISILEGIADQK